MSSAPTTSSIEGNPQRQSLSGHLDLVCSTNDLGQSCLSGQSFSTPFHISKPHLTDGLLTVMVVNPTAGIFEGDRLRSEVIVRSGARLRVVSPSASRPHLMSAGGAFYEQSIRVEAGGSLDYLPAPLIPHKGSHYFQRTRIDVGEQGSLFYLDVVAPGRVARGECFQFSELRWDTEVRWAGRLVAKEQYRLAPSDRSLESLRQWHPQAYVASGYLFAPISPDSQAALVALQSLNSAEFRIGISRLVESGWSLRLLASSSLQMRSGIARLREGLSLFLPDLAQPFRLN